jgi:4-hydroxy-tetrahydrodipicolinate reductase
MSTTPIAIAVKGAAGRLGLLLLQQIAESADFALHSALVSERSTLAMRPLPAGLQGCFQSEVPKAPAPDVVLDVSTDPHLDALLDYALAHGSAFISGNTQLDAKAMHALQQASAKIAVLHTANFSVGVALLQQLLAQASAQLGDAFQLGIIDIHHQHKADAPSGTARALEQAAAKPVQHAHLRLGEIYGEHRALLVSRDERIELAHCALNRSVFASGALRAARFMARAAPGMYSMQSVLSGQQPQ